MKNFKDYLKNKNNKEDPQDFLQSRQGKSESELYAELLETAAKGKRDGTLNDESIKAFEEIIGPMLNDEQKQKLAKILNDIKKC